MILETSKTQATVKIESIVTTVFASLAYIIIIRGVAAYSESNAPYDSTLVKVTNDTAAGETRGIILPKKPTIAACVRPLVINSAKARIKQFLFVAVSVWK